MCSVRCTLTALSLSVDENNSLGASSMTTFDGFGDGGSYIECYCVSWLNICDGELE